MDKERVVKWMNRLAKATKTVYNTEDYDVLRICQSYSRFNGKELPYVHIYEGLHEAAELLGLELTVFQENNEYKWYGTVYNGVLFVQLDRKEQ